MNKIFQNITYSQLGLFLVPIFFSVGYVWQLSDDEQQIAVGVTIALIISWLLIRYRKSKYLKYILLWGIAFVAFWGFINAFFIHAPPLPAIRAALSSIDEMSRDPEKYRTKSTVQDTSN
ncbi:MAG: hypothetical protein K8F91_00045 [Candidatus Obscuribacterales bacterium]|nr:hypothetical protein [Candidatus Obscuribacterales bacterium]